VNDLATFKDAEDTIYRGRDVRTLQISWRRHEGMVGMQCPEESHNGSGVRWLHP
jgi:hypothetical protein